MGVQERTSYDCKSDNLYEDTLEIVGTDVMKPTDVDIAEPASSSRKSHDHVLFLFVMFYQAYYGH